MANKSKSSKKKGSFSDYTFAEITIPKADREKVEEWGRGVEDDMFDLLHQLLENDYSLKLNYSDTTDSITCSLTGKTDQPLNAYVVLVSHAETAYEAMVLTFYKHYIICSEGEWPTASDEARWG